MLVAVIISHRLSPRATAQFGAEGKCSENIFATMRSEAIRNKPATRNRIVRIRPILRTEVDETCSALFRAEDRHSSQDALFLLGRSHPSLGLHPNGTPSALPRFTAPAPQSRDVVTLSRAAPYP